jgi:hypothetical protein
MISIISCYIGLLFYFYDELYLRKLIKFDFMKRKDWIVLIKPKAIVSYIKCCIDLQYQISLESVYRFAVSNTKMWTDGRTWIPLYESFHCTLCREVQRFMSNCLIWTFHLIVDGSFMLVIQRIKQILIIFSSFSLKLDINKGLENLKGFKCMLYVWTCVCVYPYNCCF